MTQEEKELLIKDLCARLPYSGVQIHISYADGFKYDKTLTYEDVKNYSQLPACSTTIVKPYLRPMSSMTEKEKDEFLLFFPFCRGDMYFDVKNACVEVFECPNEITLYPFWDNVRLIDWLNKKMFDYRGLIPNGLALEAKEGMYNN